MFFPDYVVFKSYVYKNGVLNPRNTLSAFLAYDNGEGYAKTWLTTWDKNVKLDALAKSLIEYYKKYK